MPTKKTPRRSTQTQKSSSGGKGNTKQSGGSKKR